MFTKKSKMKLREGGGSLWHHQAPHPLPNQSHHPTRKASQPSPSCSRRQISNNQTLCLSRQSTRYWAPQQAFRWMQEAKCKKRKMSWAKTILNGSVSPVVALFICLRTETWTNEGSPKIFRQSKAWLKNMKEVGVGEAVVVGGKWQAELPRTGTISSSK